MKFALLRKFRVVCGGSVAVYKVTKHNDERLQMFAHYLADEVLIFVDQFSALCNSKDCALNPSGGSYYSTGIRFGMMCIGHKYYAKKPCAAMMRKDQYADMIRNWDKLIHSKVDNILVTSGEGEAICLEKISDDLAAYYMKSDRSVCKFVKQKLFFAFRLLFFIFRVLLFVLKALILLVAAVVEWISSIFRKINPFKN